MLSLLLGYIGFTRYTLAMGHARAPLDNFYLALQLFTLESGAVPGPLPPELQVARLLAPTALAYTAVKALLVVFHEQLQLFRVRFLKDHVIVCGLGRRGALLVRSFRDHNYPVVGIEEDSINGLIGQCRNAGAVVLKGDAVDRQLLRLAGAGKASYLIAVCGDDGTNAEVAVHARELVKDRRGSGLTCFVNISDLDLIHLLREREISTQKADAFRIEFFNAYDSGARALLSAHPPFGAGAQSHVLVVGLTRAGTSLVVRMARLWHTLYGQSGERLMLTVVDPAAGEKIGALRLRYPQLNRVCNLEAVSMDSQSPEFQGATFLNEAGGSRAVTAAYVCLGEDARGLSAALALRQHLRGRGVPIVVTTRHEAGLGALLRGEDGSGESFDFLYGFGLLDRACSPDLLLGGTYEILARVTHEAWLQEQRRRGETIRTNALMVPWEELPEDYKNSNRAQANHIGVKLEAVGCAIAPLDDWDAALFEFTSEEVELMAEMEHGRWAEDRRAAGWRYGPVRDNEKKIHPDLIPWTAPSEQSKAPSEQSKALSEKSKELDRVAVRGMPAFLAQAGFAIYRVRPAAGS